MTTSAPATGPRLAVRRRPGATVFTATRVMDEHEIELQHGLPVRVSPGMWLISLGDAVIEALSESAYEKRYQPADVEGLLLDGAARTTIERVVGFGSTDTADHLATAIRRLANFKIGEIQVDYTPGEWDAITARAAKRGLSVDAYLQQLVTKLKDDLLVS